MRASDELDRALEIATPEGRIAAVASATAGLAKSKSWDAVKRAIDVIKLIESDHERAQVLAAVTPTLSLDTPLWLAPDLVYIAKSITDDNARILAWNAMARPIGAYARPPVFYEALDIVTTIAHAPSRSHILAELGADAFPRCRERVLMAIEQITDDYVRACTIAECSSWISVQGLLGFARNMSNEHARAAIFSLVMQDPLWEYRTKDDLERIRTEIFRIEDQFSQACALATLASRVPSNERSSIVRKVRQIALGIVNSPELIRRVANLIPSKSDAFRSMKVTDLRFLPDFATRIRAVAVLTASVLFGLVPQLSSAVAAPDVQAGVRSEVNFEASLGIQDYAFTNIVSRDSIEKTIITTVSPDEARSAPAKDSMKKATRSRDYAIDVLSRHYGVPAEVIRGTMEELSASRVEAIALMPDATLQRLHRRYEQMLLTINLPADGFTTLAQAQAAGRLGATYRNLVKRQRERNLVPLPKDPRVTTAERLKVDYYREHPVRKKPLPSRRTNRPGGMATPS